MAADTTPAAVLAGTATDEDVARALGWTSPDYVRDLNACADECARRRWQWERARDGRVTIYDATGRKLASERADNGHTARAFAAALVAAAQTGDQR